jgi:hypothetical protein
VGQSAGAGRIGDGGGHLVGPRRKAAAAAQTDRLSPAGSRLGVSQPVTASGRSSRTVTVGAARFHALVPPTRPNAGAGAGGQTT